MSMFVRECVWCVGTFGHMVTFSSQKTQATLTKEELAGYEIHIPNQPLNDKELGVFMREIFTKTGGGKSKLLAALKDMRECIRGFDFRMCVDEKNVITGEIRL